MKKKNEGRENRLKLFIIAVVIYYLLNLLYAIAVSIGSVVSATSCTTFIFVPIAGIPCLFINPLILAYKLTFAPFFIGDLFGIFLVGFWIIETSIYAIIFFLGYKIINLWRNKKKKGKNK